MTCEVFIQFNLRQVNCLEYSILCIVNCLNLCESNLSCAYKSRHKEGFQPTPEWTLLKYGNSEAGTLSADSLNKSVLITRKKLNLFFTTSSFLGLRWLGFRFYTFGRKVSFLISLTEIYSIFRCIIFLNPFPYILFQKALTIFRNLSIYNFRGLLLIITLFVAYWILYHLQRIFQERGTKLLKENLHPSHRGYTSSPFSTLGGEG